METKSILCPHCNKGNSVNVLDGQSIISAKRLSRREGYYWDIAETGYPYSRLISGTNNKNSIPSNNTYGTVKCLSCSSIFKYITK